MAISPISSVSFRNNNNQVNFGGRKEKPEHSSSSLTNTLRSIPLATLIALSPLCEAYALDKDNLPSSNLERTFYTGIDKNDQSLGGFLIPKGTIPWDGVPTMTYVQFFDNDRDNSDYEKLVIETYPSGKMGLPDKIYVKDFVVSSTYNTDTGKTKTKYIIEGRSSKVRANKDGERHEKLKPGVSTEVSKEVFEALKRQLGDAMRIKVEKNTTNNELEQDAQMGTMLFGM